jgi:hypothetical protein
MSASLKMGAAGARDVVAELDYDNRESKSLADWSY